jgi:FMN phosphatase YigB (HAD superfamily)
MQRCSVVITDLDNTLFDWVDIWFRSFKPMLDSLVAESGISRDFLERDFQAVFQKHETSEYAFAITELECLRLKHPGHEAELDSIYKNAIQAFRDGRTEALKLYPTVLETLETLKDRGCLLVGYTESQAFYTEYRLRKLGLDRVLDYLFSPPDHELPAGKTPEQIRLYPAVKYRLRRTIASHTPPGAMKPNPELLRSMIDDLGARLSETIYVGDSLMKDVVMAKAAGVLDVFAKYGAAQDRMEYGLLRRVTHWTPAAVQKEKDLTEEEVGPSMVLDKEFGQILSVAEFVPYNPSAETDRDHLIEGKKVAIEAKKLAIEAEKLTLQQREAAIDCWKKTVDVQQHFNDLELRIRNFAVTLLTAIVGLSAFALKENLFLTLFGRDFSIASVLLLIGAGAWCAFWSMEQHWYHRYLKGAVNHGTFIEKKWAGSLPEMGLGGAISLASRAPQKESPPAGKVKLLFRKVYAAFTGSSASRLRTFYLSVLILTVSIAGLVQIGTHRNVQGRPPDAATATTPSQSHRESGVTPGLTPELGVRANEIRPSPTGAGATPGR